MPSCEVQSVVKKAEGECNDSVLLDTTLGFHGTCVSVGSYSIYLTTRPIGIFKLLQEHSVLIVWNASSLQLSGTADN